jgi:NADH-quinone oxidoreductase subunit H
MDQLMNFSWKFILPMTLLNIIAAGVWRFMPGGPLRWLVCSALIAGPFIVLGRATSWQGKGVAVRKYRYAE